MFFIFYEKLREKLFCAGLDAFGVFVQLSADIYCAAIASKSQQSFVSVRNPQYLELSGELRFLSIRNWSQDLRSRFLQFFERLLLRTLTTYHPSSSFSSLLLNHLKSHSHPGDLGVTSIFRSFPILWRLYLTIEVEGIRALRGQHLNSISEYLVNEDIRKRLTLLFRGDESAQMNNEVLMGRDLSLFQGSLRVKSLWMESCLGDLILLHFRLEKLKKQNKREFNPKGFEEEESVDETYLILKQLRSAMEKRELACRVVP